MSYTVSTKYGTGIGRIYITDPNDNLVTEFKNNKKGKQKADRVLLASASVIGETLATATVTYTGGAGTTTNLTVDGVEIFDTGTPITGASTALLATNTATAINAFTSSPNFTAQALGGIVYIFIAPGFGSDNNGDVVSVTVTSTLTFEKTDLRGGTSSRDTVDSQTGFKIYLNLSASAPLGNIAGASNISDFIVRKPYNSPNGTFAYTLSTDTISVDRKSVLSEITVDTEGSASADNLKDVIPLGFNNGDWLLVRGKASARVVTFVETGNINLSNNVSFATANNSSVICLEYIDGDFFEIFRSPTVPFNVSSLRDADFPQGVLGVKEVALTAGGGTLSLEPGVDEQIIIITGSDVTLSSSWTIEGTGTPKEGDKFHIYIDQEITLNGNDVTIFGIELTALQALSETTSGNKPFVIGQYATAWRGTLILNSRDRDLVDTIQLATKEDDLGNPDTNGQVLSSLTDGTRYWVDLPVGSYGADFLSVRKNLVTVPASPYLPKSNYGDYLTGGTVIDTLDEYETPTTESGIFSTTSSFNPTTGVFTAPEGGYYYLEIFATIRTQTRTSIPVPFRSNLAEHRSQDSEGFWMKRNPISSVNGDFTITAVSTGSNQFTISGDHTDLFQQTKEFYINGSTGNDGLYVALSSSLSGGDTLIVIDPTNSPAGAVTDSTVDGTIHSVLHSRTGSFGLIVGVNSPSIQSNKFTVKGVVTEKTSFLRIFGSRTLFLSADEQLILGYSNNTDLDYYGSGSGTSVITWQFTKINS